MSAPTVSLSGADAWTSDAGMKAGVKEAKLRLTIEQTKLERAKAELEMMKLHSQGLALDYIK